MPLTLSRATSLRPDAYTGLGIQLLKGWADGAPPVFESNKFRLTFAGVTIPSTCVPWTTGSTKQNLVRTLNGAYDTGGTVPVFSTHNVTSFRQYSDLTCTTLLGSSFTDSPVTMSCGSNAAFTPAPTDGIYISATLSGTPTAGADTGIIWFFDAFIPRCNFLEGVVANNNITAPGYFTTSSGSTGQRGMGYGGTVTINRLCCDCA